MNLTNAINNSYPYFTTAQSVVGFGRSFGKGASYAPALVYGFFCAYRFMVGVWGSLRACRFLYPVDQPCTSAALSLVASGGGYSTIVKEAIMPNLIPFAQRFIAGTSTRTVSARHLHEFLDIKRDFSNWIKARIKQYRFQENLDYISTLAKTGELENKGLRVKKEYFLTLDMAKELAMVERNEKGDQARRYFLDCEKKLTESKQQNQIPQKPPYGIKDILENSTDRVSPQLAGMTQRMLVIVQNGESSVHFIPEDVMVITKDQLPSCVSFYLHDYALVKRSDLNDMEAAMKSIRTPVSLPSI